MGTFFLILGIRINTIVFISVFYGKLYYIKRTTRTVPFYIGMWITIESKITRRKDANKRESPGMVDQLTKVSVESTWMIVFTLHLRTRRIGMEKMQ